MTESNVLIEWVDAVCEEAKVAAQAGDTSKVNALGRDNTLRYYFNNVYMLANMSRATFQAVPVYMRDLERLYEADLKATAQANAIAESVARQQAMEEQIAELNAKLSAFMESVTNATVVRKPKGKPAPQADADEPAGDDED